MALFQRSYACDIAHTMYVRQSGASYRNFHYIVEPNVATRSKQQQSPPVSAGLVHQTGDNRRSYPEILVAADQGLVIVVEKAILAIPIR